MRPPDAARRLPLVLLLATAWSAWAGTARAACDVPYTSGMATEDLGQMNVALRNLDEATFTIAGARMDAGLACMTERLPVAAYASAYRFLGAWRYLSGDPDIGTRWFRTALEVDPAFDWDVNDLPPGHPIRQAFDGERAIAEQAPAPLEGMVLDPPQGTSLYLDGRPLTAAAATTGRPHVLQLISEDGTTAREGWLIDGNALPESLLITERAAQERAAALAAEQEAGRKERKKREPAPEVASVVGSAEDPYSVKVVKRLRPRAKTPLLVTGAVGIAASGVLYGLSFPAHARFEEAGTTDALLQAQTATNTLVIASGATLAVGLGIGVVGIQLDSTPGLVFGRRF